MIQQGQTGVQNVMYYLDMLPGKVSPVLKRKPSFAKSLIGCTPTLVGILHVPELSRSSPKRSSHCSMRNIFGDLITDYKAPQDGI
ncbi:MAG: hypothetical protein R2784_14340 [Saprospiraceae bacterium]